MDQQRMRRVFDLFHSALQREPESRPSFLDRTCAGDAELRRQVELLLAKEPEAESFLETPALGDVTLSQAGPAALLGHQLGPYRIDSLLGAGGMGEVYRAHDSKLGRDVALKTLPAEFACNPERLARFRREARTLASLNHPNIATIYGVEESSDVDCLVLELVEGETLRGPLPVEKALECARQIAEALAVAHEKGIIHRDLKPANVKVTPQGRVKVLDFGLAKAVWGTPENGDASQTATLTGVQTLAGGILGTPGYMSPEQARGADVDKRADIWAFGCLLYELLAGKQAFEGNTGPERFVSVLEREPDWQALPVHTPAKIRELLRRCLQKEPSSRPQDINEALAGIESVRSRRGRRVLLVSVAAAVLLGAVVAWLLLQQQDIPGAPIITRLTTDSGLTAYPALSPDGRLVAYASDRASNGNLDIWVQQTDGSAPIRLTTNGADDLEPNLSPDGQRVVFRSEREGGGIYVIPTLGGVEQRIAALGRSPRFSPDGKWIAYWVGDRSYFGRRHILVVPATGGQSREIQPDFFFATHPVWSPDSSRLLFRGARDAKDKQLLSFDWWLTPLDGGAAEETGAANLLVESNVPAVERSQLHGRSLGVDPSAWLGDSVFFSASSGKAGLNASLWRVRLSSRNRVEGPVRRLTTGTEDVLYPSAAGTRVAFASVMQNENVWTLAAHTNSGEIRGEPRRLTFSAAADIMPVPSADGRKLAFASNRNGNMHVWMKDLETGAETALTTSPYNELPSLLSGDGTRVVYFNYGFDKPDERGCFIGPTDGGAARKFCRNCPGTGILDWFDGVHEVLYKKGLTTKSQMVLREIDSGRETLFLEHPTYSVTAARFSPDGNWVSFQVVIESATKRQIFVAPVRERRAAAEAEWIAITDGSGLDRNAVWSPDGNLLYFLSERDGFRCIWAQRLDRATKRPVDQPFAAYHFHQARHSLMPAQEVARIGLSVTRDQIIFSMAETVGNVWLATFK
jgi:Tol biopolymer transport system component